MECRWCDRNGPDDLPPDVEITQHATWCPIVAPLRRAIHEGGSGKQKLLAWRLGCMAEAMVSAKVGPQGRFFTRERVDEIVLLLRDAERVILEDK